MSNSLENKSPSNTISLLIPIVLSIFLQFSSILPSEAQSDTEFINFLNDNTICKILDLRGKIVGFVIPENENERVILNKKGGCEVANIKLQEVNTGLKAIVMTTLEKLEFQGEIGRAIETR